MVSLHNSQIMGRTALWSLQNEGLGFLWLWARVRDTVPGWLSGPDARTLYALAHHGPGHGAIVEIGSAWGKSTIFLASGSKRAGREHVVAIDPHTGDPTYLSSRTSAFWPPRRFRKNVAEPQQSSAHAFNSYDEFQQNLQKRTLDDWVTSLVTTSEEASKTWFDRRIRLLFVDGLHSYAAVSKDISDWVPSVIPGGVIVFDDYFNDDHNVGVRRAVDELVQSGSVSPPQHEGGVHVWVYKLPMYDFAEHMTYPTAQAS